MKSLILAALMLVATVVSTVTATEFCPDGTIDTNVTIALDDDSGPTHTIASGCVITAMQDITIDASMDIGTPASPPSTVTVDGTNIGSAGVLIVIGSTSLIAQTRAPYVINILNNRFGNDACLFFRGALPAGSEVTVRGNRFNASSPLFDRIPAPYTSVSTWAASILFHDLTLVSAKVHILENDIYGSDIYGNNNIFGIYAATDIYFMGAGSHFNVNSNNISSICNPLLRNGICGYGIKANNLYAYTDGEYTIDNNNFVTAGCLVTEVPYIVNILASLKLTFNGNRGSANTQFLPLTISNNLQPFVLFNSINLQSQSAMEIKSNVFDISGTSGMFGFYGDFIFTENSSLIIANNKLTTRTCTPGIYLEEHSTAGSSRVSILNNEFYRDDDTAVDLPMVYFAKSFGLKEQSTLTVAYNTFGGRVAPTSTMLMDLSSAAVNSFTFSTDAKLLACGNVVAGKARLSTSDVWNVIHTSLRTRVSASGCGGTPLPTNLTAATTTTARTTRAGNVTTTAFPLPTEDSNSTNPPLNNGGATEKLSFIAALAAIGVALLLVC